MRSLAGASGWYGARVADASGWYGELEVWLMETRGRLEACPTGMGQEWVRSQPVAVRRQLSVGVDTVVGAGAGKNRWAARPRARPKQAREQKIRGAVSLIAGREMARRMPRQWWGGRMCRKELWGKRMR